MAAKSPRPDPDRSHPGEPGVTTDRRPPFVAEDEPTRWLFSLNRFGIRPGLQRIQELLAALDHPEQDVTSIVVAGTNGKGSTTRMLAALLQGAGYRVACFTSPHLLRVYERITVNDRPCAPDRFASELLRLRPAIERCDASWFESLTALALNISRAEKVDFLCCETGLGGRLDATNALPAIATILTSVALDHRRILGGTVSEIASEKLGLLKPDVPLFSAVGADLRSQVFAAAVRAGSPCHFLDELVQWRRSADRLDLVTRHGVVRDLPRLPSEVLQRNLALAWLCLDELAARGIWHRPGDPAGLLRRVFLPGRFQVVLTRPDWIFDTAHNSEALSSCLDAFLALQCNGRRHVLFGCMRDKELGPEVGERLRRSDNVVAAPISLSRSRNQPELVELLREWGVDRHSEVHVAPDPVGAISRLAERIAPQDIVLVTGSCFLVAEVFHRLGMRDVEETRAQRPAAELLRSFGFRAQGNGME